MNKICIVGGGFVGLTSAAYFSDQGFKTVVVDLDQDKINKILDTNKAPFFEPGLDEIIKKNISKTLFFTSNLADAIHDSNIVYVCVGTPVSESGKIDLFYIEKVSEDIGKCLSENNEKKTVVIKSTVVPGTTNGIVKKTLEFFSGKKCGEDFFLAMNPEFLREGSAVWDTYNPDRIIMGSEQLDVSEKLTQLFLGTDSQKIFHTNTETAEISKYCSNSFFALLISFSNEIAKLCETLPNVDSRDVFETLYNDRRVNVVTDTQSYKPELISYLWPGIGYGGSCFPKDILALENFASEQGLDLHILKGISQTNQAQTEHQLGRFLETYSLSKVGLLSHSPP